MMWYDAAEQASGWPCGGEMQADWRRWQQRSEGSSSPFLARSLGSWALPLRPESSAPVLRWRTSFGAGPPAALGAPWRWRSRSRAASHRQASGRRSQPSSCQPLALPAAVCGAAPPPASCLKSATRSASMLAAAIAAQPAWAGRAPWRHRAPRRELRRHGRQRQRRRGLGGKGPRLLVPVLAAGAAGG